VIRDDELCSTNFYFCQQKAPFVWFSGRAQSAIGLSVGDLTSARHVNPPRQDTEIIGAHKLVRAARGNLGQAALGRSSS
jgi:hypothetical protein